MRTIEHGSTDISIDNNNKTYSTTVYSIDNIKNERWRVGYQIVVRNSRGEVIKETYKPCVHRLMPKWPERGAKMEEKRHELQTEPH